MYKINAVGVKFNIEYKKTDDDNYDCLLSVTAFNNSISKLLENEVIYSKDEELSFERKNIDKAVGSILVSLYNKCISGIESLGEMRSEYNKYFYRRCIINICREMFSNKILGYTDSSILEFTILIPTGNRVCSIYGTIPTKLKCDVKNNSVFTNIFTIKHPDISNYEFLSYSVSRDTSKLIDGEKIDFAKHYPSEYVKICKDISANVISMINGVDLQAKIHIDARAIKTSIENTLFEKDC